MRHCIFVVGTRAQLVKVAPVLIHACYTGLPHTVWLAGQHTESIDDLVQDFQITSTIITERQTRERSSILGLIGWLPGTFLSCRRYALNVARESGQPPLVVVHGDTLSALVGAIAGRTSGADIVHLESGLSSGQLLDPFPEEVTRRFVFRMTRFALCPNSQATQKMKRRRNCEAIDTGENTLLDCVRFALAGQLDGVSATPKEYFVASIHRFQNIYRKSRLSQIIDEIVSVSAIAPVEFVLHPATEARLRHFGLFQALQNQSGINLNSRMPYTRFLGLLASARGVFSDGGSNQEELSYLGVPTILFRDRSERPDGIGENIQFRSQINDRLDTYIATGQLDKMRTSSRLDNDIQPSKISVAALKKWSDMTAV